MGFLVPHPVTGTSVDIHHFDSEDGSTALEEPESAIIGDANQKHEEDDDSMGNSDPESEDEAAPQKPQISERRRNQNKAFQSWFVMLYQEIVQPASLTHY
jgi:hypothetical protein